MSFVKTDKFSKTKAIVLNLLLQEDVNTKTRLYPPYKYIVWLNNLFTSVRLLQRLQAEGIGAAGTIRTVRTKRKEQEGKDHDGGDANCQPKEQISPTLVDLKLYYNNQIKWGKLYIEVLKDGQVMELT